jgi:hypothetical protein
MTSIDVITTDVSSAREVKRNGGTTTKLPFH